MEARVHVRVASLGPRQAPGDHPVEEQTQLVHVGRHVRLRAEEALRRHRPEERAAHTTPSSVVRDGAAALLACDAEVEQHRELVAHEHDVLGLQVAVHEAFLVQRAPGAGAAPDQPTRPVDRERPSREPLRERLAAQEGRGDERAAVAERPRVDHLDERCVANAREEPRLGEEALLLALGERRRARDLEGATSRPRMRAA